MVYIGDKLKRIAYEHVAKVYFSMLKCMMMMIFIEEKFFTKVVSKKDLYAKHFSILYKMIKYKTTNRITIKNMYIAIKNIKYLH